MSVAHTSVSRCVVTLRVTGIKGVSAPLRDSLKPFDIRLFFPFFGNIRRAAISWATEGINHSQIWDVPGQETLQAEIACTHADRRSCTGRRVGEARRPAGPAAARNSSGATPETLESVPLGSCRKARAEGGPRRGPNAAERARNQEQVPPSQRRGRVHRRAACVDLVLGLRERWLAR